jgi:hypothetical protein
MNWEGRAVDLKITVYAGRVLMQAMHEELRSMFAAVMQAVEKRWSADAR